MTVKKYTDKDMADMLSMQHDKLEHLMQISRALKSALNTYICSDEVVPQSLDFEHVQTLIKVQHDKLDNITSSLVNLVIDYDTKFNQGVK